MIHKRVPAVNACQEDFMLVILDYIAITGVAPNNISLRSLGCT